MPPQAPRILIVEDDEIIRNLISTMLQRKEYEIAGETALGEEAIIMAAELQPDLVLMDITLAGKMDGVTAARFIFQLFQVPVVFLTAHCDDTLIERAKSAQPLGYILKPFTDKELISNVGLALYNHGIRKKFLDMYPTGNPKTLLSVQDLVLILDPQGRIVFYNPHALRILNLKGEDLLMHNWREVMTFLHEGSRAEIPDPVPEVVSQMVVIMRETNTLLLARQGGLRKVIATVRPIKDDKHELLGVFMYVKEKPPENIRIKPMGSR
jgi:CheY-like chemotaxis protein